MNKHQILMDMRNEHKLKGLKPSFVVISSGGGKLYTEGTANYVMSYKEGIIYFQFLSFFLHSLNPKKDFQYPAKLFKTYRIDFKGNFKAYLYLYTQEGKYLQVYYERNLPDTGGYEENIFRMLEELKKLGIKEEKDYEESESDSEPKESN